MVSITLIEREETGILASKPGRHISLFGADGKVHQAALKVQEFLALDGTGVHVLLDGLMVALTREGILQLYGDDGETINEDYQVYSKIFDLGILQLPDDCQAVTSIALVVFRRLIVGRTVVEQLELSAIAGIKFISPQERERSLGKQGVIADSSMGHGF